jgi:hypothetical protein
LNPQEELDALQDVVQDILSGIQEMLQSGERMTDEFQGQVAQLLDAATQRIDELQMEIQGTPPIPPQDPDLNASMPSSNISQFGYDEKNGRLLVQFLGKYPDRDGPIYAYGGVPKQIFDLFQKGAIPARTDGRNRWGKWWKGKVPSMGASMYTLIKGGGYPYERIS